MVSAPPPSSSAGTPFPPNYCQLPEPPSIPNCKPQPQISDPTPPASFTLTQVVVNPTDTHIINATTPPQILPQIHHSQNVKPHKMKLKFGLVYQKVRIQSLVTWKRTLSNLPQPMGTHGHNSKSGKEVSSSSWKSRRKRKLDNSKFDSYTGPSDSDSPDSSPARSKKKRSSRKVNGASLDIFLVKDQKQSQTSGDLKTTWVNHRAKYHWGKSQKQILGRYYQRDYGPVKFAYEICISRKYCSVSSIMLFFVVVYEWSRSGRNLSIKHNCANWDYNEAFETMLRGIFDKAVRENGESMSLVLVQFVTSHSDFLWRLQLHGLFNQVLHKSMLVHTGDMNLMELFLELLISGTSIGGIYHTKFTMEFFGNNMESHRQCFRELFSSLQFGESLVNLNFLKAQFRSSNEGDFIYDMCVENWTERTKGNASKLSSYGKSEVLILDQETNFQQRISYLEKATGLLKNNFGLSFASISLYYGDNEHKQLKFGLVLGLIVYTSRMQPELEHIIGSNMNQFYNRNFGVKWVRVVHICNQPSNSSIAFIGFLLTVLELSHGSGELQQSCKEFGYICGEQMEEVFQGVFDIIGISKEQRLYSSLLGQLMKFYGDTCFSILLQVHVIMISFLISNAWPFNALSFALHLCTCKPIEQVMLVDYALAILMKERLNSILSINICTAVLAKKFYIGSSLGAMEVMVLNLKNTLLWDKVLTWKTLIKSFSVHNFSSEAFEVNCKMISYSLQLGINLYAVTDNCSYKEFEMENLYELMTGDLYKLIGQHCNMFLWSISASVKPDLKLLFMVAKNFKPTGNLLFNALYDVLGVTLITAISFNKARKIIMVMSNAVHEPCKTSYVQVLIEVSKTLQLVEDDITKLDELFDKGPMYFPHSNSAPTPLRNFIQLSLEHSKQVKVFSLQGSHKKSICQQRCSFLAELKINLDAVICANTLRMRYWFNWELFRYANTTILAKNLLVGPQCDLMNGSFSWMAVHKLKEVIRNA